MHIDHDTHNATSDTSSFELGKEAKESSAEVLVEQSEALGIQFDYDGSLLDTGVETRPFRKKKLGSAV